MAKEPDANREAFWREALQRRANSRMTVVEFCASEGLKTTTYHYWKREIKRRDRQPQQNTLPPSEPTFVPVQLVDDRTAAAVEIVTATGLLIRVGEQATTEHLRRVLQAISELS